ALQSLVSAEDGGELEKCVVDLLNALFVIGDISERISEAMQERCRSLCGQSDVRNGVLLELHDLLLVFRLAQPIRTFTQILREARQQPAADRFLGVLDRHAEALLSAGGGAGVRRGSAGVLLLNLPQSLCARHALFDLDAEPSERADLSGLHTDQKLSSLRQ